MLNIGVCENAGGGDCFWLAQQQLVGIPVSEGRRLTAVLASRLALVLRRRSKPLPRRVFVPRRAMWSWRLLR